MGLKITRGTIASPAKAVLHGVEGIGKTTWCAKAPRPLFLDTEKGTKQLAVDRVDCRSWSDLEGAVLSLGRDREGYETVVIDSIDWAEQLAADALCKEEGKKSIEEFGFGKGYVILADRIRRLLHHLDGLVDRGMNVILIAHTKVARVSPPDQTDGYDRYELRTTKQVSPLIREWPDLLLFANYRVSIKEGTDGRAKAIGGRERVMYANRSAAWDAKNRHGLPDVLPFEFARVAHLFATTKIAATALVGRGRRGRIRSRRRRCAGGPAGDRCGLGAGGLRSAGARGRDRPVHRRRQERPHAREDRDAARRAVVDRADHGSAVVGSHRPCRRQARRDRAAEGGAGCLTTSRPPASATPRAKRPTPPWPGSKTCCGSCRPAASTSGRPCSRSRRSPAAPPTRS